MDSSKTEADQAELERKRKLEEEERTFKVAKEVAEQIWREQQLTSSRMTWNLTFQSFMLAAMTVTFVQAADPVLAVALRLSVSIAGLVVAGVTLQAVKASAVQRNDLKEIWKKLYQPHPDATVDLYAYPRPFANDRHSKRARRSPANIVYALLFLWVVFIVLAVVNYLESDPRAAKLRHFPPVQQAPAR